MDFKKTNPTVIKTMFSSMDKTTFDKNIKLLEEELANVEISSKNSNYRNALLSIYSWVIKLHNRKFK